jgi:hypothetical protein
LKGTMEMHIHPPSLVLTFWVMQGFLMISSSLLTGLVWLITWQMKVTNMLYLQRLSLKVLNLLTLISILPLHLRFMISLSPCLWGGFVLF